MPTNTKASKLTQCNDPKHHRVRSVSTENSETKWIESPLKLDHTQAYNLTK